MDEIMYFWHITYNLFIFSHRQQFILSSQSMQFYEFNFLTSFIVLEKISHASFFDSTWEILSKISEYTADSMKYAALQSFFFASLCTTLWAIVAFYASLEMPLETTSWDSWKANKDYICFLHQIQFLSSRVRREFEISLVPFIFEAKAVNNPQSRKHDHRRVILENTIKNLTRALDTNWLVRETLLVRRERERKR